MHPQLYCRPVSYRARQQVLLRSEVLSCPGLTGPVEGLYPIYDQCRVTLRGCQGEAEEGLRRYVYDLVVPLMLVGQARAQRAEAHLSAEMRTPFSEEKMRFGSVLVCDCDLYPRCACEVGPGLYRVTYDARVELGLSALRCA